MTTRNLTNTFLRVRSSVIKPSRDDEKLIIDYEELQIIKDYKCLKKGEAKMLTLMVETKKMYKRQLKDVFQVDSNLDIEKNIILFEKTAEENKNILMSVNLYLSKSKFKENFIKLHKSRLQDSVNNFGLLQQKQIKQIESYKQEYVEETKHQTLLLEEEEEYDLDNREKEIDELVKSVYQISNIFNQLNDLVITQGTILDRIDYNMEQSIENMSEGNKNLVKAETYQKSSGNFSKYIVYILAFLIILMLLVYVIKSYSQK